MCYKFKGLKMTERELRALERRKTITVSKMPLHSSEHHSFHLELNCVESWNLLYSMSIMRWENENSKSAPLFVDKTVVRKISLREK